MPVDEFGREIKGARPPPRAPSPTNNSKEAGYGGSSRSRRSESPPRRRPRPIERYVQEPMLCQYVWKDQVAAAVEKEDAEAAAKAAKGADADADADDPANDADKVDTPDNSDDGEGKPITVSGVEPIDDASDTAPPVLTTKTTTNTKETYDEYRQSYCLNYVRAFFNEHMDDSWFRNKYSPLGAKRVAMQNLERAAQEAKQMKKFLSNEDALPQFVAAARLGGGVKERNNNSNNNNSGGNSSGNKRRYGESEASSSSNNNNDSNVTVPTSHVFDISNRHLKLMDVPPHVTEEQLRLAILDHAAANSKTSVQIFSGSVRAHDTTNPLYRDAYCVFSTPDSRAQILANIQKASVLDETGAGSGSHIPRKQDDRKVLELDIECSDPYGRLEIEDEAIGGNVPHRKASVFLATAVEPQKVVVLSASLSSQKRITKDKEAALILARALDVKHKIPENDCRLDDLLVLMGDKYSDEDVLDVAIAYLRRVHLFSFYNGCVFTDNLANVQGGHHATSTIHLRLKGADEILQKAKEGKYGSNGAAEIEEDNDDDDDKAVDLLVRRLDESIRKATEAATTDWMVNDPSHYVNVTVDAEAGHIEEQEKRTELEWVDEHGIIDEDGRARCSFHFCRKLFKDMTFLEKHLKKKHSEFCKAEIAKCHDSYMMKAWDSDEVRPVPSILVDCGSNFGLVPSPVLGAATPMAADPETELWEKEEERRKRLEELQRERHSNHRHRHNSDAGDGDAPPPPPRRSNFVDVDDMKEEKVELSFADLEVPVQPPKKKKRKKKLL